MASKYGKQKYGANLYSSAVTALQGAGNLSISMTLAGRIYPFNNIVGTAFPIPWTMTGRLTESEPLQGALPITLSPVGRLTESEPLQGTPLTIPWTMTGRINPYNNIVATGLGLSLFMQGSITESEPFVGSITIQLSPSGRLTESEPLQGTPLSISVVPAGRLTESEPLQGSLPFTLSPTGRLAETSNLRGGVSFAVVPAGDLRRVSEGKFVGNLSIPVMFNASISESTTLVSNALNISISIGGGDTIFFGPFWEPDTPIDAGWGPGVPADGGWVPDTPMVEDWEPVTVVSAGWVPDEPVPVDEFWVPITPERQRLAAEESVWKPVSGSK